MKQTKEITIPIYRGKLIIMITDNEDDVISFYPEFDSELYAHSFLANWEGRQGFICVLNFKASRSMTNGCIAHEATHIAHMILEQRGVFPDFINDEPIAYLVEWLTDEIYKFIKQKGFKVKLNGFSK